MSSKLRGVHIYQIVIQFVKRRGGFCHTICRKKLSKKNTENLILSCQLWIHSKMRRTVQCNCHWKCICLPAGKQQSASTVLLPQWSSSNPASEKYLHATSGFHELIPIHPSAFGMEGCPHAKSHHHNLHLHLHPLLQGWVSKCAWKMSVSFPPLIPTGSLRASIVSQPRGNTGKCAQMSCGRMWNCRHCMLTACSQSHLNCLGISTDIA